LWKQRLVRIAAHFGASGKQKTEDRKQNTEYRRQRTEDI